MRIVTSILTVSALFMYATCASAVITIDPKQYHSEHAAAKKAKGQTNDMFSGATPAQAPAAAIKSVPVVEATPPVIETKEQIVSEPLPPSEPAANIQVTDNSIIPPKE